MKKFGVKHIVYTDISKDGTLTGPNVEYTKLLTEKTGLDVIASGGVSCMDDLTRLHESGIREPSSEKHCMRKKSACRMR